MALLCSTRLAVCHTYLSVELEMFVTLQKEGCIHVCMGCRHVCTLLRSTRHNMATVGACVVGLAFGYTEAEGWCARV